jgi:hypothetical protein
MATHHLSASFQIDRPIDEVFAFFSRPENLGRIAALPLTLLPSPPLTPDAVDFINQAAAVELGPRLARMPRRLTPLDEGLASYLGPGAAVGTLTFDHNEVSAP